MRVWFMGTLRAMAGKDWRGKSGQDLLAQFLSGLVWLNGNANQPPTPFGLASADMLAAMHLVQGLLACLVRHEEKAGG
jgi:crotonobetainyl-CoA:carnitine CoA-transferase CaiB-like acyl-CoA transferase